MVCSPAISLDRLGVPGFESLLHIGFQLSANVYLGDTGEGSLCTIGETPIESPIPDRLSCFTLQVSEGGDQLIQDLSAPLPFK